MRQNEESFFWFRFLFPLCQFCSFSRYENMSALNKHMVFESQQQTNKREKNEIHNLSYIQMKQTLICDAQHVCTCVRLHWNDTRVNAIDWLSKRNNFQTKRFVRWSRQFLCKFSHIYFYSQRSRSTTFGYNVSCLNTERKKKLGIAIANTIFTA